MDVINLFRVVSRSKTVRADITTYASWERGNYSLPIRQHPYDDRFFDIT